MTGINISTIIVLILCVVLVLFLVRLGRILYKRMQELMVKEIHSVLLSEGDCFLFSLNNKGKWRWEHEDAKGKLLDKTRWKFNSQEAAVEDAREHGLPNE